MDDLRPVRPLRIAVLVKQIPVFEEMRLGSDGRLVRDGLELHMNDYCRRAVRTGCDLAVASGGTCTAITLGPPVAHTVLREAILCGCGGGLHVSDPAFAGSDTLATARALAAALELHGPWDLVLCGRNSVDADTGQVPAELAELLGLPLLAGVRELALVDDTLRTLLEHDDERLRAEVGLPAVVSCAERLCDPCKVKDPGAWATVDAGLLTTVSAADLGAGPWGQAGSPTSVGEVLVHEVDRARELLAGTGDEQVNRVIGLLRDRGAFTVADPAGMGYVPPAGPAGGPDIVVVAEPDRERSTAELLGVAAGLATRIGGHVVVAGTHLGEPARLSSLGADAALMLPDTTSVEDVAHALSDRFGDPAQGRPPWAVLTSSTDWGREVASRIAARLGAGLTGDAIGLEARDGRLVALKPAFGGRLVAEISCSSPVQMATVRPGVLPVREPRAASDIPVEMLQVEISSRVTVTERVREDDSDLLATARVVIGVGVGVDPALYPDLRRHAEAIGAELCATRRVTDRGWMPRARQVGITGHSIAPRLYVAVGASGKFNHMIGVRSADTIVGINTDTDCELWDSCDIGLVGDWRDVLERLIPRLAVELGRSRQA